MICIEEVVMENYTNGLIISPLTYMWSSYNKLSALTVVDNPSTIGQDTVLLESRSHITITTCLCTINQASSPTSMSR